MEIIGQKIRIDTWLLFFVFYGALNSFHIDFTEVKKFSLSKWFQLSQMAVYTSFIIYGKLIKKRIPGIAFMVDGALFLKKDTRNCIYGGWRIISKKPELLLWWMEPWFKKGYSG